MDAALVARVRGSMGLTADLAELVGLLAGLPGGPAAAADAHELVPLVWRF